MSEISELESERYLHYIFCFCPPGGLVCVVLQPLLCSVLFAVFLFFLFFSLTCSASLCVNVTHSLEGLGVSWMALHETSPKVSQRNELLLLLLISLPLFLFPSFCLPDSFSPALFLSLRLWVCQPSIHGNNTFQKKEEDSNESFSGTQKQRKHSTAW